MRMQWQCAIMYCIANGVVAVLALYAGWHISCCAWLLFGCGSPQCVRILTFQSWFMKRAALPWLVASDAAAGTLGVISNAANLQCNTANATQQHKHIASKMSRSSKVMLVLWSPRLDHALYGVSEVHEKLRTLQMYCKHFLSVVWLQPRTVDVGYLQSAHNHFTTKRIVAQAPGTFFCRHSWRASAEQYGCMAELLQVVLSPKNPCRDRTAGVLFAHTDMWLSPRLMSLPFSAGGPLMLQTSWKQYLGGGVDTTTLRKGVVQCATLHHVQAEDGFIYGPRHTGRGQLKDATNSSRNSRQNRGHIPIPTPSGFWNWEDGSPTFTARSAVAQWGASWHQLTDSTLSVGWADAYFVPMNGMVEIAKIMKTFAAHGMPNEAAVPTAFFLACRKGALSITTMACAGSCCSPSFYSTEEFSQQLRSHPCGHKWDLSQRASRDQLRHEWERSLEGMSSL